MSTIYAISYTGGSDKLSHILIVGCENKLFGRCIYILTECRHTFLKTTKNITGTEVVSNNPIVVYLGHECTFSQTYVGKEAMG